MRRKRGSVIKAVLSLLLVLLCLSISVFETCASVENTAEDTSSTAAKENEPPVREKKDWSKLVDENADWGTFYDPKKIFCGKFDCYKILGFDYETFHKKIPDKKDITQSYRKLSREWHPDKNKKKGAKERFVAINKAYEVLTTKETRDEYDYFRDRPDEYFHKYGSNVIYDYAPKSDAVMVVVFLVALLSLVSYYVKRMQWQRVADHITKSALDGLGLREGGSTESLSIRKKAQQIQEEREEAKLKLEANGVDSKKKSAGKKGAAKLSGKEKKKQQQDDLRAVIVDLVNEIHDFGGGFRKPTFKDLFVCHLVMFPWNLVKAVSWHTRFFIRRKLGKQHSEAEVEYLTKNAVGLLWDSADEEEREEMKKGELWIDENLITWKEDQAASNLSAGNQKRYRRWKKKEGSKLE